MKNQTTIRKQLLRLFIPIATAPPIMLFGIILIVTFSRIHEQSIRIDHTGLEQINRSLDDQFNILFTTITRITDSKQFIKLISHKKFTTVIDEQIYQAHITARGNDSPQGIIWARLFSLIDGTICLIHEDIPSHVTGKSYLISYFTSKSFILDYQALTMDPLYQSINQQKPGNAVIGKLHDGVLNGFESDEKLTVLFRVNNESKPGLSKLFMVVINRSSLVFPKETDLLTTTGHLIILDRNDRIIYKSKPDLEHILVSSSPLNRYIYSLKHLNREEPGKQSQHNNSSVAVSLAGTRYSVTGHHSHKSGITFVYFHSRSDIYRPVLLLFVLLLGVTLLLVSATTTITILFSRRLSNPIQVMAAVVQQNREGFFHKVLISTNNEISLLADCFNEMIMEKETAWKNLKGVVQQQTDELEENNRRLKKLDTIKNNFITNLTHDFRSPLTVILNMSWMALRSEEYKNDQQHNKVILQSALKMKMTVDRLLDLAKMDTEGVSINVTSFNCIDFLHSITDFYRSAVTTENITININLPKVKNMKVATDRDKLEQILDNIFFNAVKFVPSMGARIDFTLTEEPEWVIISIKDNGIGIEHDKLEYIFKRFKQTHATDSSKIEGSGIGLTFARELVEYLHGKIWAESDGPGTGSIFHIQFKKILSENRGLSGGLANKRNHEEVRQIIEMEIESKQEENNDQK